MILALQDNFIDSSFFDFPIYIVDGESSCNIVQYNTIHLVVLNNNEISSPNALDLLNKILSASKINQEDLTIVSLSEYKDSNFLGKYLFNFTGVAIDNTTPISFPSIQEQDNGLFIIHSYPLEKISQDVSYKKKLWELLKSVFLTNA